MDLRVPFKIAKSNTTERKNGNSETLREINASTGVPLKTSDRFSADGD